MKVRDLMQTLSEVDPDMEVIVDGYELGFLPCRRATQISVHDHKCHNEFLLWLGEKYEEKMGPRVQALLID